MSKRGRMAALAIIRKIASGAWQSLRMTVTVLGLVKFAKSDEAASLVDTVLAAFVNLWKILTGLLN